MKNKIIVLHPDDIPCVQDLIDTISRLKKDYKLLNKIQGIKDKENPEAFKAVFIFLEMLIGRERRNLNKEPEMLEENTMEVLMTMLHDHLTECGENTTDIVEKTKLGEWARNYATKSGNN